MKLPPLGEGIDKATVVEWARTVGDTVSIGDALITIGLDKVDTEVPSPVDGTIVELLVEVDEEIEAGVAICLIET